MTSGLPTAESDSADSHSESESETADEDGDGDGDEDGTLGEACEDDDDCSSQYVCIDERCREPCSQTTPCADGDSEQLCTVTDDPNISVCLDPCSISILQNDCDAEGEACKRAPSVDGETVAVCVPNPGNGEYGAACTSDGECAPGFLCTPALTHVEPCLDGAAFCCTSVCDVFEPNCVETEPVCVPADIAGQENVGYCGAP